MIMVLCAFRADSERSRHLITLRYLSASHSSQHKATRINAFIETYEWIHLAISVLFLYQYAEARRTRHTKPSNPA